MALGELIKDLIRSNTLTYEEGHIEILDIPGVMLPASTYFDLLEEVARRTDEDVLDILFEVGLRHGEVAVEDVGRKNNTSKRQFIETIKTGNVMGMGKITVEYHNLEEEVLVTSIKGSPLNSLFRESDVLNPNGPVHHFFRGVMHTISEEMFNAEVESEEEQCEYLGDDKCVIRCETIR